MFTKPKKIHEVERLSNVVLGVSPAPALAPRSAPAVRVRAVGAHRPHASSGAGR